MDKVVYSANKWMSFKENAQGTLYVAMDDAVLIVPLLPDNQVLFLNEHAAAFNQTLLLLPTGAIEKDEHSDHGATANRELQEEMGYKAARLDYLGMCLPMSKYVQVKMHIYLARDLSPSTLQGDEQWEMRPETLPLSAVPTLIKQGRLQDANVITALYLAQTFLSETDG